MVQNTKRVLLFTGRLTPLVNALLQDPAILLVGIVECSRAQTSSILPSFVAPATALQKIAQKYNVPYFKLVAGRQEPPTELAHLGCDVGVSYSVPFLLNKNVFLMPRLGTVNLHPSLLPSYAGPNPWFWLYCAKEACGGYTTHRVTEKADAGPIYLQQKFTIPFAMNAYALSATMLQEVGIPLLLDTIHNIDMLEAKPQDGLGVLPSAAPNIVNPASAIDWEHWPIKRIAHVLNGFPHIFDILPQPGYLRVITKWVYTGLSSQRALPPPYGRILKRDGEYCIPCGKGVLYVARKIRFKRLFYW